MGLKKVSPNRSFEASLENMHSIFLECPSKRKKHVFHQANLLLLLFQQEKTTTKDQNLNSFPSRYPIRLQRSFPVSNALQRVISQAWCGDCRALLFHGRKVVPLSEDHVPKRRRVSVSERPRTKKHEKCSKGDSPKKNKQAKKQTNNQPSKQTN